MSNNPTTTTTTSSSSSSNPTFTLTITSLSSPKKSIQIPTPNSLPLSYLKSQIALITSIPASEQRLVCSGRVITSDNEEEAMIGELFKDGQTVSVVKARVEAPPPDPQVQSAVLQERPPPSNPFGIDPAMMPLLQPLLDHLSDNPEFLANMMNNDPRMQNLFENNPEARQMMSDPAFLRQMGSTMRSPAAMQEMMRNHDRQLANIENVPGGFAALSSLYSSMGGFDNAIADENPSTDAVNEELGRRLGADDRNQPLPNPWGPPPPRRPVVGQQDLRSGMGMGMFGGAGGAGAAFAGAPGGFGGFGQGQGNREGDLTQHLLLLEQLQQVRQQELDQAHQQLALHQQQQRQQQPPPQTQPQQQLSPLNPPTTSPTSLLAQLQQLQSAQSYASPFPFLPPAATVPSTSMEELRARYATQLEALNAMGFHDEAANVRALRAAGGNVEAAINFLFGE